MAYTLIPFPLSILFGAVFVVAVLAILWKLGKTGKIYRVLFWSTAALLLGLIVLAVASAALG
jgi:hypothetical protein